MTTHYETLGVQKTVTADELKKVYRKLASEHHPDRGGDTAKFQEIQAAYDILSDPNKREQYNYGLENGEKAFHFHSGNAGDMGDIFTIFRQHFGGQADPFAQFRQQRQPQKNRDVRVAVRLELVDTLTDQTRTLTLSIPGVSNEENIEIKIPQGVFTGAMIRYPGLGDKSHPNLPRGDLYVQIHVNDHPVFQVHGADLVMPLAISAFEAITGCEKEIVGLDGHAVALVIPKGAQYGTKFGIKDQGLYNSNAPGKRGRLIVILDISIPTNLSDEQLSIIKSMQ